MTIKDVTSSLDHIEDKLDDLLTDHKNMLLTRDELEERLNKIKFDVMKLTEDLSMSWCPDSLRHKPEDKYYA